MKTHFLPLAFILVIFTRGSEVAAQDFHLSQYYASPLTLNPANTGMYDGDHRGHVQIRSQWQSLVTNPFTTALLSYDKPWLRDRKYGYGGYLIHNTAGRGGLTLLSVMLSGAYNIPIDPHREHTLTTGLQLGITHRSVNVSNLTFDNQYSFSYNGGDFDPSLSNGENFTRTGFVMFDANYGISYRFRREDLSISPFGGFALQHLTGPKETFLGSNNHFPRRWNFYGGADYKINEKITATPHFLLMYQAKNTEIKFGALGFYYLEKSDAWVFLGPYYRNRDAAVIHAGLIYKKEYRAAISYDINTSPLKSLTRSRGGFEITFTYTREKADKVPSLPSL